MERRNCSPLAVAGLHARARDLCIRARHRSDPPADAGWRDDESELSRARARRPHAHDADAVVAHDESAVAVSERGLLVNFAFTPLPAHEDVSDDALLIAGTPRHRSSVIATLGTALAPWLEPSVARATTTVGEIDPDWLLKGCNTLHISVRTARDHIASILAKLGARIANCRPSSSPCATTSSRSVSSSDPTASAGAARFEGPLGVGRR